ncbi:MAG: hypothetical protein ACREM8_02875 [Vulcanimicrobiaceae bacterium]
MGFEVSQNLKPAGFEPGLTSLPSARSGANAAELAPFAPLGADNIQSSPLAFFGDMVQQIGKAMSQDGLSTLASGSGGSGASMNEAMGILENVVALMSASNLGNGGAPSTPGALSSPASLAPPASPAAPSTPSTLIE